MRNGPYILVVAPKEYPGKKYRGKYIYEHHFVWWQNTGEIVEEPNLVHHKDENKHNNAFDNLEKKTRSKHAKEHAKPPKYVTLVCNTCGSNFERRHNQWITHASKGQTEFYCNRKCSLFPLRGIKKEGAHSYSGGCRCNECKNKQRIRMAKYRAQKLSGRATIC